MTYRISLFFLFGAVAFLGSCSHQRPLLARSRVINVRRNLNDRVVYNKDKDPIATPNVVDLTVDFSKKVTATSEAYGDQDIAMDDAVRKAIAKAGAMVLVDPIFEIRDNGSGIIAKVTGFAGHYGRSRTVVEELQALKDVEQESISRFEKIYGSSTPKHSPATKSTGRLSNLAPIQAIKRTPATPKPRAKRLRGRFFIPVRFGTGNIHAVPDDLNVVINDFDGTAKTGEIGFGWNITDHLALEYSFMNLATKMTGKLNTDEFVRVDMKAYGAFVDARYNLMRILAPRSRVSLLTGLGAGYGQITMDNVNPQPYTRSETDEQTFMWRASILLNLSLAKHIDIFAGYEKMDLGGGKNIIYSSGVQNSQEYETDTGLLKFGLNIRF